MVRWSSGDGRSGQRPIMGAERDETERELAGYLAEAGIEAPPEGVEWRIVLPIALEEEDFWERMNDALCADAPTISMHPAAIADALQPALRELLD